MDYVLGLLLLSPATEWAHGPYMILNPLNEIYLNPAGTSVIQKGSPALPGETVAKQSIGRRHQT